MADDPPESKSSPDCHFTYQSPIADSDLFQGDLLDKTPALLEVLKVAHPLYSEGEDYTHFLVLTQSCDLVRRNSKYPKARYITLAAVRPLTLVLQRKIDEFRKPFDIAAGVCSLKHKTTLNAFLQQILNNNNTDYFYLNPDPVLGLHDPSCAFLRLTISLRAYEHYERCLQARLFSLTEVFRAKLGWLTGNVYSRVATADWVPNYASEDDFNKRINKHFDGLCKWVAPERLDVARAEAETDTTLLCKSPSEIRSFIDGIKLQTKRQVVVKQVVEIAKELGLIVDDTQAGILKKRLENDPTIIAKVAS